MNLWTFTSFIDFYDKEFVNGIKGRKVTFWQKTNDYVGWVNHVLKLLKSFRLDMFRVAFPLTNSCGQDIDRWILEFTLGRSTLQKLELDLSYFGSPVPCQKAYVFPDVSVPHHSHLIGFRSLRELSFKAVDVTGQVIQFFLHNCWFLEELTVHCSSVLVSLEVSGPSLALKHLEVCYCVNMESLVVSDTNLASPKVMNAGPLRLEKVPALVHVHVGDPEPEFWGDVFSRLSCCLSQLLRLTLVINDTKLKLLKHHKFPQLTKLNELVLDVCIIDNRSMLACTHLIRAAPFLKRVVVKMETFLDVETTKNFRKARKIPLPNNLEVVEMCRYSRTSSQLELVMYFLENAPGLKKIIIDPRLNDCSFTHLDCNEDESTLRLLAKKHLEGVTVPPNVEVVVI